MTILIITLIALILYYQIIFVSFMTGFYETKKKFLLYLIPYFGIIDFVKMGIISFKNNYNKLK